MSDKHSQIFRNPHRTSNANNTNEIWTDLIGIEQTKDAGTNTAIEASIKAPGRIGGAGVGTTLNRRRRGTAGDEAVIHPTEALVALARLNAAKNRADGNPEGSRGFCTKCGGSGHLSTQCKNQYSLLKDDEDDDDGGLNFGTGADTNSSGSSSSSSSSGRKKRKRRKKSKKSKKSKGKKRRKSGDYSSSSEDRRRKRRRQKSKKKKSKKRSRSDSSSASSADSSSDSD